MQTQSSNPVQENNCVLDVIILGGGPAALSAALTLSNAGRRVRVCDDGEANNASAPESHDAFSRAAPPTEWLQGRTVEITQGKVTQVLQRSQGAQAFFEVELCPAGSDCRDGDGRAQWLRSHKLLLATGLPSLPALQLLNQLGCQMSDGLPALDACGQTTISGVYVAGDTTGNPSSPSEASSESLVANGINNALTKENLASEEHEVQPPGTTLTA